MNPNTKYKDSVFTFLFSNLAHLRALCEALLDVSLPPDVPIAINTLQDVLFMDRINDISCIIGSNASHHRLLILIEHQSTLNPNMAIRLLLYVARLYEKIFKDRDLYSSKPLPVPYPELIVLYNGAAPFPDEQILPLSDLFENPDALGISRKTLPDLELRVRIVNINAGRNQDLVRRCAILGEYSAFIATVRDYEAKTGDRAEAITGAVKYCRERGILREILEEHASEVCNMLMTEWNMDDALAVRYEEGWESGLEKGQQIGREEDISNLLAYGMSPEQVAEALKIPLDRVRRSLL